MKRFQVDIKPNHQPYVRHLMKKLGNVSSADAIGFLIETQMTAALARLEPVLRVSHLTAENPLCATETSRAVTNPSKPQQHYPQDVARNQQITTASHTTPIDDATNALDALLSA